MKIRKNTVTVFSDIVKGITEGVDGEDLAEKLLLATTMVYTISRRKRHCFVHPEINMTQHFVCLLLLRYIIMLLL